MTLKSDIVNFLRTNPNIGRLNFEFKTSLRSYKVYPSAYSKDVADAINTDAIIIRSKGAPSAGAGAGYDLNYDSLELSPSFSISNWRDQAFLVHECTHAHLDIQGLGSHSGHENEAVAYLAEALFLEAAGNSPLGSETIRTVSHGIAKGVIAKRTYGVAATDTASLVAEVAKNPHYSSKVIYRANGFNRSWVHNLLR